MAFERGQARIVAARDEKNLVRLLDGFRREIEVRRIGDDQGQVELKLLLLQPMRDFGRFQRQRARHAGPEALPGQDPDLGHALQPREKRVLRPVVQRGARARRTDNDAARRGPCAIGFQVFRAHAGQDGADEIGAGLECGGEILPAEGEKHGFAQCHGCSPRGRAREEGRCLDRLAAPGLIGRSFPRGNAACNDDAKLVHARPRNRGRLPLGKHLQRAKAVKRLQLRIVEHREGGYLREELNIRSGAFHGAFLAWICCVTKRAIPRHKDCANLLQPPPSLDHLNVGWRRADFSRAASRLYERGCVDPLALT